MKTKLRVAYERFVNLKSLWQEMAVLKLDKILSTSKLRSLFFFNAAEIFAFVWHLATKNEVRSWLLLPFFDGKISTTLKLSLVYVFKFWRVLYFARAIMSLSWLHKTIWAEICMLYYVYFVKIEYFLLFFGKYQIVAQSRNSPKFENMLPANHFCRKFYGGAACGNQTVIVTIGYVIMSIITKLFGCKLDKQYNAEHLIHRVLPNCIKHSMQVHRGLV